jgi:DNA-binding LacI/PurR family transcriptional regulator
VRVQEDVNVVGFDDIPVAAYAIPSLTTVRQPIEDMSRRAIDQVLELIDNRGAVPDQTCTARPASTRPARLVCQPSRASMTGATG